MQITRNSAKHLLKKKRPALSLDDNDVQQQMTTTDNKVQCRCKTTMQRATMKGEDCIS